MITLYNECAITYRFKAIAFLPLYLFILLPLIVSCTGNKTNEGVDSNKAMDSLRSVITTATVEEQPMSDELLLNGDIACDESLVGKVFLPCTGRVSGVSVEVGDRVTKGQTLAVVHSTDAAEQQADLNTAKSQLRVAERQLQMEQDMHASGMASDKDVAEARAQVAQLRSQLGRLAATSAINRYGSGSTAVLKAPLTGFITAKNVYNDSYIDDSGNDVPAFEVADISRVWVVADVYESDIAKVHQGSAVTVTTMAYPNRLFRGRIDKIYSMIDADSKTMKVRITLQNREGLLKPGMFATVHVQLDGDRHQACSVPAEAVVFENGNSYVVVRQGSSYQRRQVWPIHSTDSRVWLRDGDVQAGETVVVKNALLVYNALGD